MESDSDCSNYTTYSQALETEKYIADQRKAREEKLKIKQQKRETYYDRLLDTTDFDQYQGLIVVYFKANKIKLRFHPTVFTNFVPYQVIFTVSLRYTGSWWRVRRAEVPTNFKSKIYDIFNGSTTVNDINIMKSVEKICQTLVNWCGAHDRFCRQRYEALKKGELTDMDLNDDEAEIFLTEDSQRDRIAKISKILARMIPPERQRH